MKDCVTMERRNTLIGLLGLALSAWFFGLTASPATALSITGNYTDLAGGSFGTTGPIPRLVTGRGGPLGSSLVGGFLNATTLGNIFWTTALGTGVTVDASGTRADNATRPTLNSSSFAPGQVGDFTKYLATHWAVAFSDTAPVTFSLSGDDHAFLFIDGKLGLDDGRVKSIGARVATAAAFTGKRGLDLFFADANVRRSGPEPARLLLFGATLVGLGVVVRRRMRGAATPNV